MAQNIGPRHRPVRLAPLSRDEWTEEVSDSFAQLPAQMRPSPDRDLPNSYAVLSRCPTMAAAIYSITTSVRLDSTLSDRARELLILRVSWLRGAEYQLLWHARLASQDGWSPEEIARTALGSTAAGWDPVEAQLLRAAEELCSDACIGDATWNELAAHYSEREMMEIVFVVGAYEMLAMALNSFGVQPEPHLPPFPPVH